MNKQADTKPRFTLEVTDREREVAKNAKKEFKQLLKQLDDALKLIFAKICGKIFTNIFQ